MVFSEIVRSPNFGPVIFDVFWRIIFAKCEVTKQKVDIIIKWISEFFNQFFIKIVPIEFLINRNIFLDTNLNEIYGDR